MAAGLMAFAPVQSQAQVTNGGFSNSTFTNNVTSSNNVTGSNSMVIPINIKATVLYVNAKSQTQKVSFSNKDILSNLGAPAGSELGYSDGDIVVFSNKTVLEDLTVAGVASFVLTNLSSNTTPGKHGGFKTAEVGTCTLTYYSGGDTNLTNNLDALEAIGIYAATTSDSGSKKNAGQNETIKFKSTLSGVAFDSVIGQTLPVNASVTGGGSGNITPVTSTNAPPPTVTNAPPATVTPAA